MTEKKRGRGSLLLRHSFTGRDMKCAKKLCTVSLFQREKERAEAEEFQRWTKSGSFRRSHNMKLKGNISQSHEVSHDVISGQWHS